MLFSTSAAASIALVATLTSVAAKPVPADALVERDGQWCKRTTDCYGDLVENSHWYCATNKCEQHCDEGFTMSPWWNTCVANCGPNNGWRNPWTGKCSGSSSNQQQQQADTSSSISLAKSYESGYESADLSHVGSFGGDNGNAIVSWFDTSSAQDSTNGHSWCMFPYSNDTPGVAIKYSTMLNAAGGDENWARQIFCGLEMEVYANGKTSKVVVADAFSDEWVRTESSLDVVHNAFTGMLGWYTNNKNDVIQGASWKFTGRRSTQYKFGGPGSA
ncbi:hypothetical protein ACM66B_004312 [Microbotryomycetes sp. NB124-2]